MKNTIIFIALVAASLLYAEAPSKQPIRFSFEILQNGTVVSTGKIGVVPGQAASLSKEGAYQFKFTPNRVADDTVELPFTLAVGERNESGKIVLHNEEPGSVAWSYDAGSTLELRMARVQ